MDAMLLLLWLLVLHTCTRRYTRAEHEQSKQTIQQLLRELMLLRDAISRSGQGAAAAGGRSSLPAGVSRLLPVCRMCGQGSPLAFVL
jgi:hypothetical protein